MFVGSTVSGGKRLEKGDFVTATDVAAIVSFFGTFLSERERAVKTISALLLQTGTVTGMIDADGNDFFQGAFPYLAGLMRGDAAQAAAFYDDILRRVFHGTSAGRLQVERAKGSAGEILLRAPLSDVRCPFGLINVGSPRELCDHLKSLPELAGKVRFVDESDVTEPIFQTVRESSSPVNLLVGSKKFVEGWDCWRVSTLGLMHVGKSEGTQIIQLFGRGVRLKGWEWSLKRSSHVSSVLIRPAYIEELELLNVFGIEADFMQRFRDYLKSEGLPGNERRWTEKIPLNVTYDFGKRLKIVRPKRKKDDGREYDFRKDAPVPQVGDVPPSLVDNKVVCDWYPRVQGVRSRRTGVREGVKNKATLGERQRALLDETALYFALERFKRERTWPNLDISADGIRRVLARDDWYELYIPKDFVEPTSMAGVRVLRDVAAELLKGYVEKLYTHAKRQFIDPRLEVRELTPADENIPDDDEGYVVTVDADDAMLINQIRLLKAELAKKANEGKVLSYGAVEALNFGRHLFQPLFHLKSQGTISIQPVTLNDSEFRFVRDLNDYVRAHKGEFVAKGRELYLLRNLSRGRGIGFEEASNFHPDFILWLVEGKRQHIAFIEPHGLLHEAMDSDKVRFAERIKAIERRLGDPDIVLDSFILSPTPYAELLWRPKPPAADLEAMHILFMEDTGPVYLAKLLRGMGMGSEA